MSTEEVLELSVDETNKLRAELGLKPLRINSNSRHDNGGDGREDGEEVLELSVSETNKLREKIGLPPLRTGDEDEISARKEIFKPAINTGEQEEVSERIERARLQREVEQGAAEVFGGTTLASDENGADGNHAALSWALKMRQEQTGTTTSTTTTSAKDKKSRKRTAKKKSSVSSRNDDEYGAKDLEGMQVKNSMADIEAGSSMVLTLADTPILETKTSVSKRLVGINEEEDALENVNLSERAKQQDGLRKKRMLEMGMGRAGGYAGFDDEEFEELGGTQGPSRLDRNGTCLNGGDDEDGGDGPKSRRGFRIGTEKEALENAALTDYDKIERGKAISLIGRTDVAASDFMTAEEEHEEKEKRKSKKKEAKFKKKKKKKDSKRRRKANADEDEAQDEVEDEGAGSALLTTKPVNGSHLLSQLEKTATAEETSGLRKRRRLDEDDNPSKQPSSDAKVQASLEKQSKKARYDEIMEKGNERTKLAFGDKKTTAIKKEEVDVIDEEPDDSFLNAALAKARRLNRLRAMNSVTAHKGAEAVVEAVKLSTVEDSAPTELPGTISFSIDETREFSRALRLRSEQKKRETQKQAQNAASRATDVVIKKEEPESAEEFKDSDTRIKAEDVQEDTEDVDMEELAKEVSTDDIQQIDFDGSTAAQAVGVGRGLSSFVSMLKTTGEITGKHGGTEELRGRAKDERDYDNYKPMDLSKVVAIGKNATDKDKEFASREIKLEYRDKHGRLLTQKEAFRDLCYQFHGHGASKKKEEKRLKQIAREQAEARVASRQVAAARDGVAAGMLGALKATQKATGKAFIVHKT